MNPVEAKLLHLVENERPTTTTFLTKEEQAFLVSKTTDIVFVGGYKNPERMRAALYGAEKTLVSVLKISYPKEYLTLKHPQILGTLLSLGIKREHVGDILVDQEAFVISKPLAPFILQEFTEINHVPISLSEVDLSGYTHAPSFTEHRLISDSLRLDLLVSKLTNHSRDQAKLSIINGEVKINHVIITKPTKQVKDNDLLSIRRFGRVIIDDTSKTTKKNKIIIKYKKYQ